MPRTPTARPLTAFLALTGLVLVILLLGLSFASVRSFEHARDLMDHTAQVEAQLGYGLRLLVDAETGQRGFLLTNRPDYLESFDLARRELPQTIQRLGTLLRDDPVQQARLRKLEGLASAKLQELDETVSLQKAGEHARALAVVESDRGKHAMDAVRDVVGQMQSTEGALRAERNASAARLARLSFGGIATASGLLLCVGFLIHSIGRNLARREIEVAELRIADLEDFAGRIAQDVCSPLASVSLAVDLAKLHPGDPKAVSALAGAKRTLGRVCSLVDGLLIFAKAGVRPTEGEQADVRAVATDIVDVTRRTARQRGITLELEDICPTTVACSPGVLTSMVSNLVGNAVEYMGDAAERRVSVRARSEGARTRVEVRDTGPGVPRELWATIFDPYVRAPGSTAAGLGLGLAAVRRLAQAHDGSVGIAENVPAGSVFWFELPNAPRRHPRHAPSGARPGWRARLAWPVHPWRQRHA